MRLASLAPVFDPIDDVGVVERVRTMCTKPHVIVAFAALALAACSGSKSGPPRADRPVRVVTVERRVVSEPLSLTGHIRAREEVSLAFRVDGKLIERPVSIGDQVRPEQVVARLDSLNEGNSVRSAEADVTSAQAVLTQAQRAEARQRELVSKGFTTRTQYEQAQQQQQSAQAQMDSAEARLLSARDRLTNMELRANAMGTVIARGPEPGEVVRAGQMIVQLAREGQKDAVFDVPAQLLMLRGIPSNPIVEITLADNPNLKTTGRIREVASKPDAATRTFPVKIALDDPPEEMRLGATVNGGMTLSSPPVIELPGTALMKADGKPAVWVVDPDKKAVALRNIGVMRYEPNSVIVAEGLRDGEIVVTAGVHVLRPGQKVRLLGGSP
jgi:RND family efflux transporter MFP subunit